MALTNSERRTLEAVRDGKVKRGYRSDGNVFIPPPGIAPAILRRLEARRLICDADDGRGTVQITCTMQLTRAGREALA